MNKTPIVWQGVTDSFSLPIETKLKRKVRNNLDKQANNHHNDYAFMKTESPSTVMPWKCWGGLAVRAARLSMSGDPLISSSYLTMKAKQKIYNSDNNIQSLINSNLLSLAEYFSSILSDNTSSNSTHLRPTFSPTSLSTTLSPTLIPTSIPTNIPTSIPTSNPSSPSPSASPTIQSFSPTGFPTTYEENLHKVHPVVMSSCWYLDFNSDVDSYINDSPFPALVTGNLDLSIDNINNMNHTRPSLSVSTTKINRDVIKNSHKPNYYREYEGNLRGGEAAMWTEHVDFTNFDCRVWPRAGIPVSILWSGEDNSIIKLTKERSSTAYNFNLPPNFLEIVENITKYYLNYARFSYFLAKTNGLMNMAPFTIHYPVDIFPYKVPSSYAKLPNQNAYSKPEYIPLTFTDEHSFMNHIINAFNANVTKKNSKQSPISLSQFRIKITSQCPGINQAIKRPMINENNKAKDFAVVQLNIADGAQNERRELFIDYLRNLASQNVNIVGFCELNNFQVILLF